MPRPEGRRRHRETAGGRRRVSSQHPWRLPSRRPQPSQAFRPGLRFRGSVRMRRPERGEAVGVRRPWPSRRVYVNIHLRRYRAHRLRACSRPQQRGGTRPNCEISSIGRIRTGPPGPLRPANAGPRTGSHSETNPPQDSESGCPLMRRRRARHRPSLRGGGRHGGGRAARHRPAQGGRRERPADPGRERGPPRRCPCGPVSRREGVGPGRAGGSGAHVGPQGRGRHAAHALRPDVRPTARTRW